MTDLEAPASEGSARRLVVAGGFGLGVLGVLGVLAGLLRRRLDHRA